MAMYNTIEDALLALQDAQDDVIAEYGEETMEQAYGDLVTAIAVDCAPAVASELRRVTIGGW